MSFRHLKKATNNVLKIIALYPRYQFVVRYLKELFMIIYTMVLLITIQFHKISQDLNVETVALTS